ncbi:MAG TPA: hypothetical protein VF257_13940 [Solirubrobacteraceae bacterium]
MSRLRAVVAATALLALGAAATANAHQGNANYRSIIGRVTPAVPGLKLQVLNFDDRLALENTSGKTVVIQGYDGEPYARVLADGTVQVNQRSPAYYLNNDRYADVKVPASADADAAPQWKLVDRSRQFQWHDHRIHYMGQGLPPQVKDKSKRTKVFAWHVPLEVGAAKGTIAGTLYWQPKPGGGVPIGAIVALVAMVVLGAAAVTVVRRRRSGVAEDARGEAGAEAW